MAGWGIELGGRLLDRKRPLVRFAAFLNGSGFRVLWFRVERMNGSRQGLG